MSSQPFEVGALSAPPSRSSEPLVFFSPPAPELYEELCRLAIAHVVDVVRADRLSDASVTLSGSYPETQIELRGRFDGGAVHYVIDLYRPRFARMRRGRLRSPDEWADVIDNKFADQLGFELADNPVARRRRLELELRGLARYFGAGLRPNWTFGVRPDPDDPVVRAELMSAAGEEIVVEAPVRDGGVERPIWEIAEELRARALAAIGVEARPEPADLSVSPLFGGPAPG